MQKPCPHCHIKTIMVTTFAVLACLAVLGFIAEETRAAAQHEVIGQIAQLKKRHLSRLEKAKSLPTEEHNHVLPGYRQAGILNQIGFGLQPASNRLTPEQEYNNAIAAGIGVWPGGFIPGLPQTGGLQWWPPGEAQLPNYVLSQPRLSPEQEYNNAVMAGMGQGGGFVAPQPQFPGIGFPTQQLAQPLVFPSAQLQRPPLSPEQEYNNAVAIGRQQQQQLQQRPWV